MKKNIIPVLLILFIITGAKITFPRDSSYENLVKTVNTDGDETSCSFSADRKTFLFTRKMKNSKNYDIYITEYKNGSWLSPVPLKEINTEYDEISPFITSDGRFILFSSNRKGSQKNAKASKPSFDIYIAEKEGSSWGVPYSLFGAVNTSDDETNPFITPDGNTLYFTRTQFNDGTKSAVIEAGKDNDIWGENMQTSDITYQTSIRIYMARKSDKHSGFWVSAYRESKRDIFFMTMDSDGNGEILDPGDIINTAGDENSVLEIDENTIIFSSNNGISGSYDIAIKQVPDDFFPDSGVVSDKTEEKKDTEITDKATDKKDTDSGKLTHKEDKKKNKTDKTAKKEKKKNVPEKTGGTFTLEIAAEGIENAGNIPLKILFFDTMKSWSDPVEVKTVSTDNSGRLEIEVKAGIKRIVVIPDNDAVDGFAAEYIINKDDMMTGTLKLTKSSDGKFEPRPIYFDFNSCEIQLQDIPYMHELLEYMRKNTDATISIEGYSDGYGSSTANMDISIKRAEKARDYLVSRGIDSSRIKIKGHGFKNKKSMDTSQQHRRVDFLISR